MAVTEIHPITTSLNRAIEYIENPSNLHSPTVIVAPITSRIKKSTLPTHVYISERAKLDKNSVILLEQIRTIDKSRLSEYLCRLQSDEMEAVNKAISVSLGV